MAKQLTKEELLEKAKKPSEDAMKIHPYYLGKTQVALKVPVNSYHDFSVYYTPGVAASCKAIEKDKALAIPIRTKRTILQCCLTAPEF